jgi:hypothetical protein
MTCVHEYSLCEFQVVFKVSYFVSDISEESFHDLSKFTSVKERIQEGLGRCHAVST